MVERVVDYGVILALIVSFALYFSPSVQADATVTLPNGTVIERTKTADPAEILRAQGRAQFLEAYGAALAAPTVSSTCIPTVLQIGGADVLAMSCTQTYADPSRLAVSPELLRGPTTGWDVLNNFVGGVTSVAKAGVAQAPIAALAYGLNQVGKRAGDRTSIVRDSQNGRDSNRGDYSGGDRSDHRSAYGEGGSVAGAGRVGDDSTSTPTVVNQPPPTIVEQPEPTIVEQPEPIVVDAPEPVVVTGFNADP